MDTVIENSEILFLEKLQLAFEIRFDDSIPVLLEEYSSMVKLSYV